MRIFQRPRQPTIVPLALGMYYPDWKFERKHGERNCDGMVRKNSMFDPKNGAWVTCARKASVEDDTTSYQYCARHMKHKPAFSITHAQAIEILWKRAEVQEATQELFRAGEETPLLKWLKKEQKLVERGIKREWGEALDWLDKSVANSINCWADTAQEFQGNDVEIASTLHMLFEQACELARVIVAQCRSGHAQSAIILWRSLFEIEVNMAYISSDTTQVPSRAERYNDWSMASYFYVNNLLSHEISIHLQRKYRRWKLKHPDGWTAPPDNPTASLDVPSRAEQVGYKRRRKPDGRLSDLDIYSLSHSYVHSNVFGMLNDPLTPRGPHPNGPSIVGLDTPICLTARSLANTTHLLLDHLRDPETEASLGEFRRFTDIQTSQVLTEVSMVPANLLSPLGGIDVSVVLQYGDGPEYVGTPMRRGSASAEGEARSSKRTER